jgi:hypothetical protein
MEAKKEYEQLKVTNASVKWAKVITPGKGYKTNPDEWTIDMYVTDEDRDALMARGVNPKEDEDGNEYFRAKRRTKTGAGKDQAPPVVVDSKKMPFTENIGNGSVCNVIVTLFPWSEGKKKGVMLYLQAVQVVNHVAYGGGNSVDFDAVDGEVTF